MPATNHDETLALKFAGMSASLRFLASQFDMLRDAALNPSYAETLLPLRLLLAFSAITDLDKQNDVIKFAEALAEEDGPADRRDIST